jgi:fluoride exporter
MAVAAGGAFGSLARHWVNIAVNRWGGTSLPYATAFVNIGGCAVIGLLAGMIAGDVMRMPPPVRAFVFVGILGGFTTFSTLGLDTLTLVHQGRHAAALWNVLLQVGLGLPAVFAGYAVGLAANLR